MFLRGVQKQGVHYSGAHHRVWAGMDEGALPGYRVQARVLPPFRLPRQRNGQEDRF